MTTRHLAINMKPVLSLKVRLILTGLLIPMVVPVAMDRELIIRRRKWMA